MIWIERGADLSEPFFIMFLIKIFTPLSFSHLIELLFIHSCSGLAFLLCSTSPYRLHFFVSVLCILCYNKECSLPLFVAVTIVYCWFGTRHWWGGGRVCVLSSSHSTLIKCWDVYLSFNSKSGKNKYLGDTMARRIMQEIVQCMWVAVCSDLM